MNPDTPLENKCLALTGSFETSRLPPECFSCVTGNFDGMGISFGALQWNIGQGTLQPLLSRFLTEHPELAKTVLEDHYAALHDVILKSPSKDAQLAWAQSVQPNGKFDQTWKSLLWAVGQTQEFQAIQVNQAKSLFTKAMALARFFDLHTERAVALCFDIVVQNGGISTTVGSLIELDFSKLPLAAPESDRLVIIANRRAEASNSRFIEDVRRRKLCIANGGGTVHGVAYNLDTQFFIRLVPMPVETAPSVVT